MAINEESGEDSESSNDNEINNVNNEFFKHRKKKLKNNFKNQE
jgi:hypothetical protein